MNNKEKKSNQAINLLEGNISLTLTKLALPIMFSALIQMAYNLIDTIWIGRLGYQAVAAVGAAGMFIWFGDGLLLLSRTGGPVFFGQALGRGDSVEAKQWIRHAFQFTIILALFYTALQIIFAPQLISFFQFSEAATTAQAISYLRIVSIGYIFSFTTRIYTSLVTVAGRSKISMYATIIGLLLNVVLDPICIFIFNWGAAGAAIATDFSQLIVLICFIWATRNEKTFKNIKLLDKIDLKSWFKLIKVGAPPALQLMFFSSITMLLARMVAQFGDAAISIQKVGSQIESISWMTAEGFGVALTAFMAQNFGAGQWERTKKGFSRSLLIMAVWGLFTSAILCFIPEFIFKIFINDPYVIPGGADYLRILGLSQIFMCFEIMTGCAFAGVAKTTLCSSITIGLTLARIPLAYYLMSTSLGVNGLWWAITVTSIMKGTSLVLLFIIYEKRTDKFPPQYQINNGSL